MLSVPKTAVWGGGDLSRDLLRTGNVAACNEALTAIDVMYPNYNARKGSLLQARALRKSIERNYVSALDDLDYASRIISSQNNKYLNRSISLNTDIIRAFTLSKSGEQLEADALGLKILDSRPYSSSTALATLLALGQDSSIEIKEKILLTLARTNPNFSDRLFHLKFETGQYAAALEVIDEIKAPIPVYSNTQDKRTNLYRAEKNRSTAALFWIRNHGRHAYILASQNREKEARDILESSRHHWQEAIVQLPQSPTDISKSIEMKHDVIMEVNGEIQTKAPILYDFWDKVVNARIHINSGRYEEASRLLKNIKIQDSTTKVLELSDEISQQGETENNPSIASNAVILHQLLGLPKQNGLALFNALFEGESFDRAKVSCKNSSNSLQSGVISCNFDRKATLAISEEKPIFLAALKTVQAGEKSFEITERSVTKLTSVLNYDGIISEKDLGYQSNLTFELHEGKEECLLCLNADNIKNVLSEIYPLE